MSSPPSAQTPPVESVYVAVTTVGGAPVAGLGASDFVVQVDGRDMVVRGVEPATDPPSVVIVTDALTSPLTLDARAAMRVAVAAIRTRHPDARVGLMLTEGMSAPDFVGISADAATLAAAIGRFYESGRAASMLESLQTAATALAGEPYRRRAVVLITYRQDSRAAGVTAAAVVDAFRQAGASLWVLDIAIGQSSLGGGQEPGLLEYGVPQLGGLRQMVRSPRLEPAAARLLDVLLSQYAIAFTRPAQGGPGVLRVGVRRDDVRVHAPGWIGR